jgi:uncharacterized integral membrane protein (TIGR00697 family)
MQAMQPTTTTASSSSTCSNKLWFLTLLYTMITVLCNWFNVRLTEVFGFTLPSGSFLFPFTFFLTNLITEVYGYKYARLAIWWGIFFNIFDLVHGQLVTLIPSPDDYRTQIFDMLLQANGRTILAGLFGCLSSEPLNSLVMAKLKMEFRGQFIGARFLIATLIASVVDSVVFGFLAFYGIFDKKTFIAIIFGMIAVKVAIDFLALPFFLYFAKKLKRKECLDMYDKGTNFNLFRLDTHYAPSANHFKE